ncbi:MAG: hypothetical protein ACLP1X_09765 [Polyangiaceae bacterium]|jgi:hypothetical protein
MEQYFAVRRMWMVAGCTTFAAACGLSTAGERAVTSLGGAETADGDTGDEGGGYEGGVVDLGDGGIGASDGGSFTTPSPPSGPCDFNGTWGSLLKINVTWAPQGLNLQAFILAPGSGTIKQWIKGVRVQNGNSLEDTTVVCGVVLPDFQGTALVSGATYGVLFPDSLFDDNYLPSFHVDGTVTGDDAGATYSASPAAALLGVTMANPTTDPWPSSLPSGSSMVTDPDNDKKPGVTIDEAAGLVPQSDAGAFYSYVPVGIPAPFEPAVLSTKLYVAIRQVTEVTGTVMDCNHIAGTVSIPQIGGQYAINSHVLGCELEDGGDCTTSGSSSQASFVDNTQPVFTPSGTTSFASVRLPDGASCGTVRAMLQ